MMYAPRAASPASERLRGGPLSGFRKKAATPTASRTSAPAARNRRLPPRAEMVGALVGMPRPVAKHARKRPDRAAEIDEGSGDAHEQAGEDLILDGIVHVGPAERCRRKHDECRKKRAGKPNERH